MSSLAFKQSSVLSAGGQTYGLTSLIAIPSTGILPAVLVVRAYDRDVYAGVQAYDYGSFSSPNGGHLSAGTQNRATLLYFDLKDGAYVSRLTGEAISSYTLSSSTQNFRSLYLSLYTSDTRGASYASEWIDPSWQHLSDLNIVTRTNYVDPTPNLTTPSEIAALAKSFIGQVWNKDGCWLLTSNISAAAGASLPAASAKNDTANITGNGQWDVVFNGARQHDDWRALLQVGDIVELGFINGVAHIATVTSGSGHAALWVDNSGPVANTGTATDIVIQGEHSVDAVTGNAIDASVVIFRLNGQGSGSPSQPGSQPASQPTPIAPPVVTTYEQALPVGQSLPIASLFSVKDPNMLALTSYQMIDASGQSHIQLNGATNLATAAQQSAGMVIVGAADLAKLSYVAELGPNALTITAFDGQAWGTGSVTITGWVNPPPVVLGASVASHATSQLVNLAGLFSVTVPSGKPISAYRFVDTAQTGQLHLSDQRLNLANNEEAAKGIYRINARDLDTVSWKLLANTGTISVSAFDGAQWSAYADVTIAGKNTAPLVSPAPLQTISIGVPVSMASLFSLSDADNDSITMVSIYDFYDNIQLNGATDYCPFPHAYQVLRSELSKVSYTPKSVGGPQGVMVNATDGTTWSSLTQVLFNVDDPAPVVLPGSAPYAPLNTVVPLAQLFSVVDTSGKAALSYTVLDPSGGGNLALNGAIDLASAAQKALGIVAFTAADLAKVTYRTAGQASSEALTISVLNGSLSGSKAIQVTSADNVAPTFFAPVTTLDVGRTVPLTSLFVAYTSSGKPVTQYVVNDPAGGGTVLLNGVANVVTNIVSASPTPSGMVIAAADIGKLSYLAASAEGSEAVSISAYDGSNWGQVSLLINSKNFGRPVVTAAPVTLHAGESVSLHDLFSVKDANGSPIVGYQINDTEQRLTLNGAENYYAKDQYKGFYGILPTDLAKVVYVAGEPGVHTIYVEAGNKTGLTGMAEPITITVLSNPVISPSTTTVGVKLSTALTNLFAVTNPSGKALLQYKIVAQDVGGTLALNGAQNLATEVEKAQGVTLVRADELSKLSFIGARAFSNDTLTISAYDGVSWGSSAVSVITTDGLPPVVSAATTRVELDLTVPLASLFTAVSHTGLPIVQYKISDPNGGGKLVLNGVANAATSDQQAQQGLAIISAADLGKLQYVGADRAGSETLTVAAFDGQAWGNPAYLPVASVKTAPPQLNTITAFLNPGQALPLSSLLSFTNASGAQPSYYIFQDQSNHIALNGATNLWAQQQAAGYYWISASDIAKVSYVSPTDGVFPYSVIVNDGFNFSTWTKGVAVIGQERLALPPQVSASLTTVGVNQALPLSTLFSVTDPLEKAILRYRVVDPSGAGTLKLNGAPDLATALEKAQAWIVFDAADLGKIQYQGGASSALEVLSVAAYDGLSWGGAELAITSAVLPPVVKAQSAAGNTRIELNSESAISSLFSVTAASGSPITQYKFQDPSGAGTVYLKGATNLASAAQIAQGISIVSSLDLPSVQYSTGATTGRETLLIGAYDGRAWGEANIALQTVDTRAPLLVQGGRSVDLKLPVALDSLFKAVSVSGQAVLEYRIEDPAGGGQVLINSAKNLASAQQKGAGITVVAAFDLPNLLYVGGATPGSETLTVTAFDGQSSSSARITVGSETPVAPIVVPTPITLHVGESVKMADLLTVVPANGHTISFYRLLDPSLGIRENGAINIAASPLYDYRGIYDVANAADFAKLTFNATTTGVMRIVVQVQDGFNVGNIAEQVITVVGKDVQIPTVPVVKLQGSAGNDTFTAASGLRTIDGGAGIDTITYAGNRSAYLISVQSDGSASVRSINDGLVNDSLAHVERLKFNDATVALDITTLPNLSSNGASLATTGQVYRLYQAAFNRAPDAAGLVFWNGAAETGTSLLSIASAFTASPEFRDLNGQLTEHQFVEQLYQNVLHRSGDVGGLNAWQRALDEHLITREQVLLNFADSPENQAALIGVLQRGISL